MGAVDQSGEARAWLRAEIDAQCFGEEFGFDLIPSMAPAQNGGAQVMYVIVVTGRSPLLGQAPLLHYAALTAPRLTAEMVRQVVTSALRGLRDLSAQLTSSANGSVR